VSALNDVYNLDNLFNRDYIRPMSNSSLLRATETGSVNLSRNAVQTFLREHNPKASVAHVRAMATTISAIWDALAELPDSKRRALTQDRDRLREALIDATQETPAEARAHIPSSGRPIRKRGSGLGPRISLAEGRDRLDRFVTAKPLESWAGPVAGAGDIEQQLAIPRSTLNAWHKRGAIVGLLRGERKFAYPLDQFVDARPLEGMAEILRVAPDARAAWLWLRQPHPALEGKAPLALLRHGGAKAKVVEVAERDFA
jgi:hypothetical protein